MLNILFYLYILLKLHNGLLVTCENTKLTSVTHTHPAKDAGNNSQWHPIQKSVLESFAREKRVSHHGANHHHIQKLPLKLLDNKTTKKSIAVHRLNQKKQRSQQLECNKRHIALQLYAKRINQTINSTEQEKFTSKRLPFVQSSLNNYQVLKRNGNASSPKPILTSASTPLTPATNKLILSSDTPASKNVTPHITTTAQSLPPSISKTTSATTQSPTSRSSKPNKLSFSETVDSNAKVSEEMYNEQGGRTVLTKVFIIPIQERLPNIVKFEAPVRDDKTAKRSDLKSRRSRKKKKTSKVSKTRPKLGSKEKKSKKLKLPKKNQFGKTGRNDKNKIKKKNGLMERKKRLEEERKLKKNKKKTSHKKNSRENRKIETHRRIKDLDKRKKDVNACRNDKTKDTHKNLERKRNKDRQTRGDSNKETKNSKKHQKGKKKDVHKEEKQNKFVSRTENPSGKEKKNLNKYQKLKRNKKESLQKKHKDDKKTTPVLKNHSNKTRNEESKSNHSHSESKKTKKKPKH